MTASAFSSLKAYAKRDLTLFQASTSWTTLGFRAYGEGLVRPRNTKRNPGWQCQAHVRSHEVLQEDLDRPEYMVWSFGVGFTLFTHCLRN